jgi:hypothetical protein
MPKSMLISAAIVRLEVYIADLAIGENRPYSRCWYSSNAGTDHADDFWEVGASGKRYTLLQGERLTRRVTLWRRTSAGWKILYHQGTTAEP